MKKSQSKLRNLGRYIVADPGVCHGKPTFRGTRIMVWQALEMVSEGMDFETIAKTWGGRYHLRGRCGGGATGEPCVSEGWSEIRGPKAWSI